MGFKNFEKNNEYINIDSILNLKNEIIMLPYVYTKGTNIIENIFNKHNHKIFKNFKLYFIKQWKIF